jgi:hypothetical protein
MRMRMRMRERARAKIVGLRRAAGGLPKKRAGLEAAAAPPAPASRGR